MTVIERGTAPDAVLMLFGVTGFCADCGEERLLVPVDDEHRDYCCTDCDGAVRLVHLPLSQASRTAPTRQAS